MKTVLHVNDTMGAGGGSEQFLRSLLDAPPRGWRPRLAVGRAGATGNDPSVPPLTLIKGLGGRLRQEAAAVRRFLAFAEHLQPRLVHVHNVLQPALLRTMTARFACVMTIQDHRCFCPGPGKVLPNLEICRARPSHQACQTCLKDRSYRSFMLSLVAERLDAISRMAQVTTLSRYMQSELLKAGLSPEKVSVVAPYPYWEPANSTGSSHTRSGKTEAGRNSIPMSKAAGGVSEGVAKTLRGEFQASIPRPPFVLGAGRLVFSKGFHFLIRAHAMLPEPAPALVVAGSGPSRESLEEQARTLARSNSAPVVFTGWIDHRDMLGLLQRAALLAIPSTWQEPLGITGIEALSLGTPVLASQVGGMGEWLDDTVGWPVPPGDATTLANTLHECVTRRDEARRRAAAGQQRVGQFFTKQACVTGMGVIYDRAIDT